MTDVASVKLEHRSRELREPRRRPHALHRLAPARRARARGSDLRARRPLRRPALGRSAATTRRPPSRPRAASRTSPSTSARRPCEMTPDEHDRGGRARLARAAARREPARRAGFVDAPRRRRSASPGRACATRRASRQRPRAVGADPRRERGAGRRGARRAYRDDLDRVIAGARARPTAPGRPARGRRDDPPRQRRRRALPGKHGSEPPLRAGRRHGRRHARASSARLFGEIGELGVNIEDLRLEHSPGAQFGLAEIASIPEAARATRRRRSRPAAGRSRGRR